MSHRGDLDQVLCLLRCYHIAVHATQVGMQQIRSSEQLVRLEQRLQVAYAAYEDFEDPRGKYVCLLYVLREPLNPETLIEAGDNASHVKWFPIESLQNLPYLAFNHIRLLRMALRQFFISYYYDAVGMQEIDAWQCEIESAPGLRCPNTAYWHYSRAILCPKDVQLAVKRGEGQFLGSSSLSNARSSALSNLER